MRNFEKYLRSIPTQNKRDATLDLYVNHLLSEMTSDPQLMKSPDKTQTQFNLMSVRSRSRVQHAATDVNETDLHP